MMADYCGFPSEDSDKIFIILDKIDKIGKEGVLKELINAGYNKNSVYTYMELFDEKLLGSNAKNYFSKIGISCVDENIMNNLDQIIDTVQSVANHKFEVLFDPTLVRGMSYYTGPIFEIEMMELSSSVAGGGRYDSMIEKYASISVPACGFSIGFERIIAILKEKNHNLLLNTKKKVAFVIDKNISKDELTKVFKEVAILREEQNIIALVVYKSKNFKFQKDKLIEDGFEEIIFR